MCSTAWDNWWTKKVAASSNWVHGVGTRGGYTDAVFYWLRLEAAGATFGRLPKELAGKRVHRRNRLFGTRFAHHQRAAAAEVVDVVFQRLGYVPSRWALYYGRAMATADGHTRKGSVDYDKHVLSHARDALSKNASDESRSPWAKLLLYHAEEEAIEFVKRPRVLIRFLPQWPRLSLRALLDRKLFVLRNYPPRTVQLPKKYFDTIIPDQAPTISIVTPNFNLGEYLGRTIESVVGQNYPRIEYLVQDGGSTDDSIGVIRQYEDKLSSWRSEPDDGQTHAINLGMQRASGEILAYLNSDDILLPGSLAYVAKYLVDHPEVDVVYGHRLLIDENDQEVGRWVLPHHDSDAISWADYIPQETMFWRRRAWDAVGAQIDESFEFAMDWDLILRFREAGMRFVRLPRFLGAFRVMEQQKTMAMIETVGKAEMNRLREREFGTVPTDREVRNHIRPYLRRHWFADKLFSMGITGERRVLRRKVA